jgi:6-phosphogluconolactonase
MVAPDIRTFSSDELAKEAADVIAAHIAEVVAEKGRCRFGLSGGSTPRFVYEKLAELPVSWKDVELFWGDDRCVPPDHEKSNYRMANEALISRIDIPGANVFRIRGENPPEDAARAYTDELGEEPIDILMLGMGGDGHTASLFPGEADLSSRLRVIAAKSPVAPHDRVTLTMKAINEAGAVYFLLAGAGKADRLAEIEAQIANGDPRLPAAHVQPRSGRLIWLCDSDAATKLKGID